MARANPNRSRARSAAGALTSATTASLGRSFGWKSGATAVKASAWHSPMKPVPMMPTPISAIPVSRYRMPCLASSITLAASALVTKPGPVG